MARRSFGYPRYEEPQQQEVVGVPYISMYNPQDYQDYSKILEQGQQRYDVAQSAIAKYMEDYSNAPVSARNMSVLDEIVQNRLSGINELVSKKYNGEYGNAANEIVQQLALARKPIMQAQQDYVNEMRAREEFNKSQPIQFIKNPNTGKAEATPMSFEQYYKLKPSFDSEGRFTPSNFGPIRGRGEGDKWAMENISNPIMQQITSGNLTQLKDNFGDMAEVISQRGMSDADVDKYIETNSSWIIPSFLQNSKWSKEEFSNPDGSINYDLAKDYLKDIVKLQTVKSSQSDYRNIPRRETEGQEFNNLLDSFGVMIPGVSEDNPYWSRKETMGSIFGPFNNTEDIESNIKKLESSMKELSNRTSGVRPEALGQISDNISRLTERKEKMNLALEVLEDYKKTKIKEIESQGGNIPKNNTEWAKLYDADINYKATAIDNEWTMNPVAQKAIKDVWKNNTSLPEQATYRVANSKFGELSGLDILSKKLDMDSEEIKKNIQENDFNYSPATGEFYTHVGKNKVYFTIDQLNNVYSRGLKRIKEIESNDLKNPEPLIHTGNLKVSYNGRGKGYTIEVKGMNSQNFTVSNSSASKDDVRESIRNILNGHIYKNYTTKSLQNKL